MKNIIINYKNAEIEISKAFEKRASVFGSMEYTELANACKAFPKFRVSVKSPKKKDAFANVNREFIVAYIEAHDDANKTVMEQYKILAGLKEDEGGKLARVSFFELKKWFLNTYPELEEQVNEAKKRSNELLAKAAENAKNYKNKKKSA